MNRLAAKRAADQLQSLVLPSHSTTTKPTFTDVKVPQQTNGDDCGVFTLLFAEEVVSWASGGVGGAVNELEGRITRNFSSDTVPNKRKQILDLILQLASNPQSDPTNST